MLSFLSDMISRTPPEKLTQRLTHTAYDELMVIDLKNDRFEGRYHADGKFFRPLLTITTLLCSNMSLPAWCTRKTGKPISP